MPLVLRLRYLYLLVDQETQQDPVVLEIQHLLSVQVLQVHLSHLADHQGPIRIFRRDIIYRRDIRSENSKYFQPKKVIL